MKTLTWDEFVSNVQGWAQERGIYEHSTAEAQLLKALSELGELADAVIKNDVDGIKDAVGDVAVCMVNYAHMEDCEDIFCHDCATGIDSTYEEIGFIAETIGGLLTFDDCVELDDICTCLNSIANRYGLDFLECCTKAWNEIKDRKGRMVAGGAFVKDE